MWDEVKSHQNLVSSLYFRICIAQKLLAEEMPNNMKKLLRAASSSKDFVKVLKAFRQFLERNSGTKQEMYILYCARVDMPTINLPKWDSETWNTRHLLIHTQQN